MRKKYARRKKVSLKDIKSYGNVRLTDEQLNKLINNYGEDLTMFAIRLLDDKIKSEPLNSRMKKAKTHYQYFRNDGKIILFALEVMNSSEKYGHIFY